VVEDSADAREVMERLLKNAGAVVTACADASAALDWLSLKVPDVIVSDIGMPGMDGWAMMELIRSQPRLRADALPAIALTAHATPTDCERSMAAGFQEHLAKPVDFDELLRVIGRLAAEASLARGQR
jgi:CheY-like chemotaxis protein